MDYHCNPGYPVDRYRAGYKNIFLISLRGVRNRGDTDEFNINWKIRNGFLSSTGFWATEICHRTKLIRVHVIFPITRPPKKASLLEKNKQRNVWMGDDCIKKLQGGKWEVTWERKNPSLYEQYILNWEW